MPRARVSDITMNYETAGSGFPLVLIHAWPTDHAIWQLQVPVFSREYQTIAVDLRGLGQSDKPTTPNGAETMSNDVVGLLDELGIERAAVCGISLGGIVAAQMTLDHPGRVASAVWVGAPSYVDKFMISVGDETITLTEAYLRVLEPEGYRGFWQKVWKANIGLLFNAEFVQSRLGAYLIESLFEDRYARWNADARPIIDILHGLGTWTIVDRLSSVERPVQVVVGDHDPTYEYCKEQGQQTAGAEYLEIEDSGHFCNLDNAAHFNAGVLDFLRRNTR